MSKNHEKQADKKQAEKEELEKDLQPKDESAVKDEQGAGCGCEASKEIPQEEKAEQNASTGETCGKETENDKASELAKRLEESEAQCKDWQDQYLRKAADFENYRKRMIREKQEAIDYANGNLLLDLVQVLDDFDRAIDAGKNQGGEAASNAFAEGVVMIKKQMVSMLSSKYGLSYYPAKGEAFDPNLHEAVSMIQSPDVKEAVVGEELQKGYKLKERVIRHSKVMVLMPAQKQDEKEAEENEAADKTNEN
ncbi:MULTISPECIES: nucleotide exchange factor GrpE [unclassified Treponema]|uniref:nucleotide exchange factor GrpE n=1 Tax=unclassified Treponema TaxID=2638727 RepID=UPI0020A55AC6|nr:MULTISPECIES: nucleotide exchange factor GrpE [unclassified Treponema]UTC66513.1 nucleotide exchange factor GrpE [Treponema sp. OMZ 789]UTC69245.1 nucleotide exchange factor GrpE [Treponema sp. OMZ 790]UTC71958.1 nucleotide exchange factor GrpE [Treponema sp. OMZ 791]